MSASHASPPLLSFSRSLRSDAPSDSGPGFGGFLSAFRELVTEFLRALCHLPVMIQVRRDHQNLPGRTVPDYLVAPSG